MGDDLWPIGIKAAVEWIPYKHNESYYTLDRITIIFMFALLYIKIIK